MVGFTEGRAFARFRPGLLPTIIVLCLLPLLISLGLWQLDRAQQKIALEQSWAMRQSQPPLSPDELTYEPHPAFARVELNGRFDAKNYRLLDSRTRHGMAGAELLQPFYDEKTQRWFLVNRGWLPWPDRTSLPAFTTPAETIRLISWVYVPTGEPFLLKEHETVLDDVAIVNAIRPQTLWQQLQRIGYRYELRLEPSVYALDTEWPQTRFNAHTHQGYALQWFSLAAALVALFIYFGLYHARENNNEPSPGSI